MSVCYIYDQLKGIAPNISHTYSRVTWREITILIYGPRMTRHFNICGMVYDVGTVNGSKIHSDGGKLLFQIIYKVDIWWSGNKIDQHSIMIVNYCYPSLLLPSITKLTNSFVSLTKYLRILRSFLNWIYMGLQIFFIIIRHFNISWSTNGLQKCFRINSCSLIYPIVQVLKVIRNNNRSACFLFLYGTASCNINIVVRTYPWCWD